MKVGKLILPVYREREVGGGGGKESYDLRWRRCTTVCLEIILKILSLSVFESMECI